MSEASGQEESGNYALYDVIVVVLIATLVAFLLVTMGIRTKEARLVDECHERLLALAQAQQMYLVKHGEFSESLPALRPFLEPGKERIPFVCPITGHDFMVRVQGDRYKIIAPGTDYSITTGDPSW